MTGNATFGGTGGLLLAGGVTANHVLYNFTGSSGTITSHVGNVFYGTLLAPTYSFNLDGSFIGEIIGGGCLIQLLSNAAVNANVGSAVQHGHGERIERVGFSIGNGHDHHQRRGTATGGGLEQRGWRWVDRTARPARRGKRGTERLLTALAQDTLPQRCGGKGGRSAY